MASSKTTTLKVTNLGGINTYVNPYLMNAGDMLHSVNVESSPYGAKRKRQGYSAYLGTPDASQVNTLFSWTKNDGSLFLYRASGSALYYSVEGTGAWTLCGNGTITAGNHVGHAVLDNTLVIGENAGSTRHTTNGTSFTNTTLAPVGEHLAMFENRIFIGGTASTLFYSTTGSPTDWDLTAPSDSSSLTIPGAGKINSVRNVNDRIIASKDSGLIYRWDGYSLIDLSTSNGPSSPYSVDEVEGFNLYLNRQGIFGYGGDKPQILSNAIQNKIYNYDNTGIAGTVFDNAPGIVHRYDYYLTAGTVTDPVTGIQVNDSIIKYNFQQNEFLDYKFENKPTAWCSFKDTNGDQQLIFGDANGQCYKFGGVNSDNGVSIEASMDFVFDLDSPANDKEWRKFYGFFNPGCQAQISIAISDSFSKDSKKWIDLGDAVQGSVEYRFKTGQRGKLLFVRIRESSSDSDFICYGFELEGDVIRR